MSTNDHEQRIADLERRVQSLTDAFMVSSFGRPIGYAVDTFGRWHVLTIPCPDQTQYSNGQTITHAFSPTPYRGDGVYEAK